MYVCICKGITDHQIRQAVDDGASSFHQVRNNLGLSTQCGKCACLAKEIVDKALEEVAAPSFDANLCYAAC